MTSTLSHDDGSESARIAAPRLFHANKISLLRRKLMNSTEHFGRGGPAFSRRDGRGRVMLAKLHPF